MYRTVEFVHGIGDILYVGGILSHIVIGVMFAHASPEVTVTVYTYKLQSAYILILPGLALKIICDLILFFIYDERAAWMKIKLGASAFLAMNAFVFLVPMMPELLKLAEESVAQGTLSQAFIDLEAREQLVGMSNVIPLMLELIMGGYKPKLTKRERAIL